MRALIETAVQAVLASQGLAIVRNRPYRDPVAHFTLKSRELGVATVLDVGANKGQFAMALRSAGFDREIVSFEPLTACRDELLAAADRDPHWAIAPQSAVGAEDGVVEINISENLVSSSLLPISDRTITAHAPAAYVGIESVPLRQLDGLVAGYNGPFGVKIDAQGFELEVLKGAQAVLAKTQVVLLELSLVPLYDRGAGSSQVYSWMEGAGFRCIGITQGFSDVDRNEQLQADAVFVRN